MYEKACHITHVKDIRKFVEVRSLFYHMITDMGLW